MRMMMYMNMYSHEILFIIQYTKTFGYDKIKVEDRVFETLL